MMRIYLAGPDVFYPDAITRGKQMKELCIKYGFQGMFPFDNEVSGSNPKQLAMEIFNANRNMIDQCDAVIANLSAFRGMEPDSGTVFECAYAYAKGKRVYGYLPDGSHMLQRIHDLYGGVQKKGDVWVDKNGLTVENFEQPLNIMIASSVELVIGTLEDCLKQAQKEMFIERMVSGYTYQVNKMIVSICIKDIEKGIGQYGEHAYLADPLMVANGLSWLEVFQQMPGKEVADILVDILQTMPKQGDIFVESIIFKLEENEFDLQPLVAKPDLMAIYTGISA